MIATEQTTTLTSHWDVTARLTDGTTPSLQAQIDAEFEKAVSPYMDSSGWLCTITIECGTIVCACQ